jgi:hypothetical protein
MWNPLSLAVLGVWMLAAPFVIGYSSYNVFNDWVVGLLVVNFVLIMYRHWERPLGTAAGIWLLASGFIPAMRASRTLVINDAALGVTLIIAAIACAIHERRETRVPLELL